MSFDWDRIGTFVAAIDAEAWCDRHDVDRRDRDIRGGRDVFELLVRQGTIDDDRPERGRW